MKRVISIICLILIPCAGSAIIIHVPSEYPTIQAGIDATSDGDTVLVADGTYTGPGNRDLDYGGRAITVMSMGWPESCVIDCENSGRGFLFQNGETENATLSGITVQNGYIGGSQGRGGGIYIDGSSPTIRNCRIISNSAGFDGGGICCINYGSPSLSDCVISGNSAVREGGGINWDEHSFAYITRCLIQENSCDAGGGGVKCRKSELILTHCQITDNTASSSGAVSVTWDISRLTLNNCLITSNNSNGNGGIGYIQSHCTLINCTLYGNSANWGASGITGTANGHAEIINSIFWNNVPDEIDCDSVEVWYSDIRGGFSGEGNIDADPLFVSSAEGNFFLSQIGSGQPENSPCLDTGMMLAEATCFDLLTGTVCLDELTTSVLQTPDYNIADIGFHYSRYPATPTPTPTAQPDATPTPPRPDWIGVQLRLPNSPFQAGEPFVLTALSRGPWGMHSADLCVILDVYGSYWFWPSWSQSYDCSFVTLSDMEATETVILDFRWPFGDFGQAHGLYFRGAILVHGTYYTIGDIGFTAFGYF